MERSAQALLVAKRDEPYRRLPGKIILIHLRRAAGKQSHSFTRAPLNLPKAPSLLWRFLADTRILQFNAPKELRE